MHVVQLNLYTSLYLLGKHTSDMLHVSNPNFQRPYLTDVMMFQK